MNFFNLKYSSNTSLAVGLLGIVISMVILAYASVPLYNYFCKVTGFGGTPKIYSQESVYITDSLIDVRLDSNVGSTLNWDFFPEQRIHQIQIGENKLINYVIINNTDQALNGTAVYNVSPAEAAKYFNKIECFCFQNTELKANEKKIMPVSFYIDPEIKNDQYVADLSEVTLSYTFYENSDT